MVKSISFVEAKGAYPEAIEDLIDLHCNMNGVPYKYGELWIKEYFEFYLNDASTLYTCVDDYTSVWNNDLGYWSDEIEGVTIE